MVTAPQKYLFDVVTYHKMGEAKLLSPTTRLELIAGEIIQMAPMGPVYADIISILDELFHNRIGQLMKIRVQLPIQLGDFSEPEPDIAVVQRRRYLETHPTAQDVLLLIEVADSSIKHDLETKIPLYAKYGIPEVWLVDVNHTQVLVHWLPTASGYEQLKRFGCGQQLTSANLPELCIQVDDLFK